MKFRRLLAVSILLALFPLAQAWAYVGPGAGVGAFGALAAIVGAILVSIFGVILLPINMIRKWRRNRMRDGGAEKATEPIVDQ
jgi:hypothetical protein